MTHTDLGITGAKRQTWHKVSPRSLLKKICDENPNADETALQRIFLDRIKEDDEYLPAIVEYWFARNYRSLLDDDETTQQQKKASRIERAKAVEELKTKLADHIETQVQHALLDLVILPSGKTLRQSTGQECVAAGGWLRAIASRVAPEKIVGDVLSEEDVRELYVQRMPKL